MRYRSLWEETESFETVVSEERSTTVCSLVSDRIKEVGCKATGSITFVFLVKSVTVVLPFLLMHHSLVYFLFLHCTFHNFTLPFFPFMAQVSLDIHDDPALQLRQIAQLEKRLSEENKQVEPQKKQGELSCLMIIDQSVGRMIGRLAR